MQDKIDRLVQKLKEEYGMPDVDITAALRLPGRFESDNHGAVYRDSSSGKRKWTIDVVSENWSYVCTHEVLHVVLEERGCFLDFVRKDKHQQEYLRSLKYLVDDYLIETEMSRKFGETAQESFGYGRLNPDYTSFLLLQPMAVMMDLLGIRAVCNNVYPELSDVDIVTLLGGVIKHGGFDEVVDICGEQTFEDTTPDSYKSFVKRVHKALTTTEMQFYKGNRVRFKDPATVRSFVDGVEELPAILSQYI